MQDTPAIDWPALLNQALTEPGTLSDAYRRFGSMSLANGLWLLEQMLGRKLEVGPVATFKRWQAMGRMVRKGEKALFAYVPRTVKRHTRDDEDEDAGSFTLFMALLRWFTLAQTDPIAGAEQAPVAEPEPAGAFDMDVALAALGPQRIPFEHPNGNMQGYCYPTRRQIAVNPLAGDPVKTACHEMAHCILHGGEAEFTDGANVERSEKEVEAESSAYLVCASIGHTPSASSMRAYSRAGCGRRRIRSCASTGHGSSEPPRKSLRPEGSARMRRATIPRRCHSAALSGPRSETPSRLPLARGRFSCARAGYRHTRRCGGSWYAESMT